MKRKIVAYGVLFSLIGGSYVSFLLSRQISPLPMQAAAAVINEEMIVPAIIDAANDITHVPTLQSGIVKKINVSVGQMVKKGDVLFSLDDTVGQHNVALNKSALKQAENSLAIQQKNLNHTQAQLKRLKSIDPRAINQADIREKNHELKMGMLQLQQVQHNLDTAATNLKNAQLSLDQLHVLAPKDGIVLQINAHIDEFVGGGSQILLLGDAEKVIVRVSIEERDTRKYSPETSAYLTGEDLNIPLTFVQLDRYIIQNDRLNARVQEALYFYKRADYPNLAAGRQFDAHIAIKNQ